MYESTQDPLEQPKRFDFEDLTLWQALVLFIYRPVRVSREIWRVIAERDTPSLADEPSVDEVFEEGEPVGVTPDGLPAPTPTWLERPTRRQRMRWLNREEGGMAAVLLLAIIFAILGTSTLRDSALDPLLKAQKELGDAPFWLVLSALTYLLGVGGYSLSRRRYTTPSTEQPIDDRLIEEEEEDGTARPDLLEGFIGWIERYMFRIGLVPVAIIFSLLTYRNNIATDVSGNITGIVFTELGFASWVISIALWYIIFAVDLNGLFRRITGRGEPIEWHMPSFRWRWTHLALLILMLIAGYFRLTNLDGVPPDMTSDHIEKLIDAVKVDNGIYAVFFENNGGREAFQMYVVAAIADWMGVGFNFRALKYATVIEGMLTIFLSFWVAKALIGRETEERDQLGNWVGLAMAGLLAVSAWHTMLSRLGLRIVLTPLTALLIMYFLVRALRYNRRIDFVNLGLVLGLGTYFYQANRMLPLVVVAAVGFAILFGTRLRWAKIWRYGVNLLFAGVLAMVVYIPMYRYSEEFPREFWSRTYGRLFGERNFDCLNVETGRLEFCPPTFTEAFELLRERNYGPDGTLTGFQALRRNYWDAVISYMWQGDGQWITNGGGRPALDGWTAGLYMLGLWAWLVLMLQRRDVSLIVLPVGIFIMLLPSALAIAPGLNENPSFTRTSGTVPMVFWVAALPLGWVAYHIVRAGYERTTAYMVSIALLGVVIYNASLPNFETYFEVYRVGYSNGWRPYAKIAAPMAEFVEGRGSYGNAFYVNWPHWLDHRILGSSAGDLAWPNGLVQVQDVYQQILINEGTAHQYDPDKPLLFYVNKNDTASLQYLETNFPGGQARYIAIDGIQDFYVYEAPAGWGWLATRLATESARLGCIINCVPGPN
ncbi:MAG: hypothetical protein H6673_04275 [Anaerolineales bacterium]|nr:hypothetical protein [Anaerolineales bacterium]